MKDLFIGLKLFLVLCLITGVLYPALVSVYAWAFVFDKAHGSLISREGQVVGSELLAQKFSQDKYFLSRPSAIDYDSRTSGASNQGPTSDILKNQLVERRSALNNFATENSRPIPDDLISASGSGLDPHISPQAAQFQAAKIAKARNMDLDSVMDLVMRMTEKPQFGILGEARVNVLKLNLELDKIN